MKKKYFIVITVIVLAMLVVGCQTKTEKPATDPIIGTWQNKENTSIIWEFKEDGTINLPNGATGKFQRLDSESVMVTMFTLTQTFEFKMFVSIEGSLGQFIPDEGNIIAPSNNWTKK